MMALVLLVAVAAAGSAADAPSGDYQVPLEKHFTVDVFSEGAGATGSGFDGSDNWYAAKGLPKDAVLIVTSERYGATTFLRPPAEGETKNAVVCTGQRIEVQPEQVYTVLLSLGASHHGGFVDWIEFEFEDGTTGRGGLGFSDWRAPPDLFADEPVIALPVFNRAGTERGTSRLLLQRTPIPEKKRVRAIRLPDLPNLRIMALTFANRDGVVPPRRPAKRAVRPALVAVFGDPGFPYHFSRGSVEPEKIHDALLHAGIPAEILGVAHLKDPAVFSVSAYPVLVLAYGNTFPKDALANLQKYRKDGGGMIHLAVPSCHPCVYTPYSQWLSEGHQKDYLPHEGEKGLGTGGYTAATSTELVPEPMLAAWGLGEVDWRQFLPKGYDIAPQYGWFPQVIDPGTFPPSDAILPLLALKNNSDGPFAAIIRHTGCPFDSCIDIRLGPLCVGLEPLPEPVDLTIACIVRGAAWILREKGHIDATKWREIARPVPARLCTVSTIKPIVPDPEWSWHLPRSAPIASEVDWVNATALTERERVLLISAQGLLNGAGRTPRAFVASDEPSLQRLNWYQTPDGGGLKTARQRTPKEFLQLVGHRRTVVVDPQVYGSLNVATMLAAVDGLLVAYPEFVGPYGLRVVHDLRGRFTTCAEGYTWALEHLRPFLARRCLAMVDPEPRTYGVRDYLIAQKLFTFSVTWNAESPNAGASRHAEAAVASKLLAATPVCIPVICVPGGSVTAENTALSSRFGKFLVPADGLSNLSFSSGMRGAKPALSQDATAAPELEEEKIYCAAVNESDRDLRRFPGLADSAARIITGGGLLSGRMTLGTSRRSGPSGYTLPPAAFDLMPAECTAILSAFTSGQCLGSNGLGQVDPEAFASAFGTEGARVKALYWKLTDRSMRELHQRFLVLRTWRAPKKGAIAECARLVPAAAAILPAYIGNVSISRDARAYIIDGTPVIHSLSSYPTIRTSSTSSRPDLFSGTRPAFTWWRNPSPGYLARRLSSTSAQSLDEYRLVGPLQLASLVKAHARLARMPTVTLIDSGSVWKYHDKGTDLGTAWRAIAFDDKTWAAGPAELGYGDLKDGKGEVTVVSFGPDSQKKYPCLYLRHAFTVGDPALVATLSLEVIRDDGCVVYLNGTEVGRSNMPSGTVSYGTYASSAVGSSDETRWFPLSVKPSLLQKGTNVIAVELHQANATSSDLSFDLKLTGKGRMRGGR